MHIFSSVPLNAFSWTWGSLAMYVFAYKSWRTYSKSKNTLARLYYIFGFLFGTALLFFGAPGFITQDTHILRYTYFCADFFVQLSMQNLVIILWFLGLRTYTKLGYLLVCTIPFSLVLLAIEVLSSQVTISKSPYLILYQDKTPVLVMKSIIYAIAALPLAYFILTQVPRQLNLIAKLKSMSGGVIYIVVCLAAISNCLLDKGSDTVESVVTIIVFYTIFLVAQLLRPAR